MEVKRYNQFINEAKKDDAKEEILKMLNSNPTVTMSSKNWPTEKSAYSQAGIIAYLKGKYTTDQVLNALHDLKADKKVGVKHILVKNYHYNENYPYYYIGLTEAEAKDAKEKYEEKNEVDNKDFIAKKKEDKSPAKKEEVKKPAKKVAAKKAAPKKVAAKKVEEPKKAPKKVADKKVKK